VREHNLCQNIGERQFISRKLSFHFYPNRAPSPAAASSSVFLLSSSALASVGAAAPACGAAT
jgi:hypothetical protein